MKMISRKFREFAKLLENARPFSTFKASDLSIEKTKQPKPKPDWDNLVFGKHFSDHMFVVDYDDGKWQSPKIEPVREMSLHPASRVFHYAIELFEGMKAYRGVDGKIRLFRPDLNIKRMLSSAERLLLPSFDADELIECTCRLIDIERDWVPHSTSSSLYIRPTYIGTEEGVSVAPSLRSRLFVLTCPVGPYYPTGFKPVSLYADPKFVRAAPGGTGAYKLGANYAQSIYPASIAVAKGCSQMLWLWGDDELQEVGTMNLFVYWTNENGERELVTPPLGDTILPGVTRQSLLELAREWNEFGVTERRITMADLRRALAADRVLEVFGSGTACIVCPVERILYVDEWLDIPTMRDGAPVLMRLMQALTDIQVPV